MAKRQSTQSHSDGGSGFTPDIPARSAVLQPAPPDSARVCIGRSPPDRRPEGSTHGSAGIRALSVPRLSSLWLWALGVWSFPLSAAQLATPPAAAPQITEAAAPPSSELPKLVAQLSAQPALSAADCAKFAGETLTHGQNVRQSGQPVKPGIVQDGLAAVDRGERLDAKTADWPTLRSQLQDLLKPPPQQDQQKDEQKQEEQKKDQEQQQQEQKKDDQQKSEEQQQQEQQQQQSEEQKSAEQQQQEAQQQPPSQPPEDTQKIGGEKPGNEEVKEHPELAVPLQKLEQVRDQDSPAELFELLQSDEPKPPAQPKKDW